MKLRASFVVVASVLALDATPREASAAPAAPCLEIDETCDGQQNPVCVTNQDCAEDLPNCDPRHGRCVGACMFNHKPDGVLPGACVSATRPYCMGDGRCAECIEDDKTACVKPEGPVCILATGSCGCNVGAECASGVCDPATRRCGPKSVRPGSSGGPVRGGAGASSGEAGPGSERPAFSGYGGPTGTDGSKAQVPSDDGRIEGGACSISRRESGAVLALGLFSAAAGFVFARRASRRRVA